MNDRYEPLPAFTAHGQATQVVSVHPLGMVQHVDHLPEREQRIAVPSRRDPTDRAERVERDEVERIPARLAACASHRGRAVLDVHVQEGRYGALERLAPAEGEH